MNLQPREALVNAVLAFNLPETSVQERLGRISARTPVPFAPSRAIRFHPDSSTGFGVFVNAYDACFFDKLCRSALGKPTTHVSALKTHDTRGEDGPFPPKQ